MKIVFALAVVALVMVNLADARKTPHIPQEVVAGTVRIAGLAKALERCSAKAQNPSIDIGAKVTQFIHANIKLFGKHSESIQACADNKITEKEKAELESHEVSNTVKTFVEAVRPNSHKISIFEHCLRACQNWDGQGDYPSVCQGLAGTKSAVDKAIANSYIKSVQLREQFYALIDTGKLSFEVIKGLRTEIGASINIFLDVSTLAGLDAKALLGAAKVDIGKVKNLGQAGFQTLEVALQAAAQILTSIISVACTVIKGASPAVNILLKTATQAVGPTLAPILNGALTVVSFLLKTVNKILGSLGGILGGKGGKGPKGSKGPHGTPAKPAAPAAE